MSLLAGPPSCERAPTSRVHECLCILCLGKLHALRAGYSALRIGRLQRGPCSSGARHPHRCPCCFQPGRHSRPVPRWYVASVASKAHIRTRFNLLALELSAIQTIQSSSGAMKVFSTDPQPGVASVNPKPQCAFEECTFAMSCNSRYVSHFAAFFIDPRAE